MKSLKICNLKNILLTKKMDHNKIFEFTAAVRGFHYYKAFWNPVTNQKLSCAHEENNPFDMFAIKACEGPKIIGQ